MVDRGLFCTWKPIYIQSWTGLNKIGNAGHSRCPMLGPFMLSRIAKGISLTN